MCIFPFQILWEATVYYMPEDPLCLEYNRLMVLGNKNAVGFNSSVDHSSNLIISKKKKDHHFALEQDS